MFTTTFPATGVKIGAYRTARASNCDNIPNVALFTKNAEAEPTLTQPDADNPITYYSDDEADFIYACLGRNSYGGMLRIHTPVSVDSRWEWVRRGTDYWDSLHQKIYRNFRATRLEAGELPVLPQLPDSESEPPRFHSPTSFPATAYPQLASFLSTQDHATSAFTLVLGEDTYETSCGDGEFHYLEYLGKTPRDAQDYIAKQNQLPDAGYSRYHVRSLSVKLAEATIHGELQKELFDHCELENALDRAEAWAQAKRNQA